MTQKDHRLCVITGSPRRLQKGDPLFANFCLPGFCNCLPVGSLVIVEGHKGHRSFNLLSSEAPGTQETHCVLLNILFLSQKPQRGLKETGPVSHIYLSFLLSENFISISALPNSPYRVTVSAHVTLMLTSLECRGWSRIQYTITAQFSSTEF